MINDGEGGQKPYRAEGIHLDYSSQSSSADQSMQTCHDLPVIDQSFLLDCRAKHS